MWQRLHQLVQLLHLTRVSLVFTAVSNSWLMIFLALAVEPHARRNPVLEQWPLWSVLLLGAGVAAGLHVYATALNDVIDVRHDRVFSPQRPIAAGLVRMPRAMVVAVIGLLLAILAGALLSLREVLPLMTLLIVAAGVLFYNTTGKFFPAVGVLTVGLVRAAAMLVPNPWAGFLWPVLLTLGHVTVCGAIAYRIAGKRPRLQASHIGWLCAGWMFWTLAGLTWMSWRGTLMLPGQRAVLLGPIAAALVFAIVAWRRLHDPERRRRLGHAAADSFMRLSLMWLIVYDASWLVSAGQYRQGLVLVALLAVACSAAWVIRLGAYIAAGRGSYQYRLGPLRTR